MRLLFKRFHFRIPGRAKVCYWVSGLSLEVGVLTIVLRRARKAVGPTPALLIGRVRAPSYLIISKGIESARVVARSLVHYNILRTWLVLSETHRRDRNRLGVYRCSHAVPITIKNRRRYIDMGTTILDFQGIRCFVWNQFNLSALSKLSLGLIEHLLVRLFETK